MRSDMRKPVISKALIFISLLIVSSSHAREETVTGYASDPKRRENDEVRSLTEQTLAFEEMYLRLYSSMSMSMNMGKGKGKGGSKSGGDSKIGSGKGSGKGSGNGSGKGGESKTSATSKASKKSSKSKEMKVGKSKKSKKKGSIAPTMSAMPSTSGYLCC